MAQLIVAAAGAALGAAIPGVGAGIGWAIGSLVGSAFGPSQKSSGPRLSDLKVTAAEYGAPIPLIFAHPRVSGTVIWASEKREIANTESQGKGGGPEYTSYTYEIDLLYLLSDNVIQGVRRIWSNGKLVWSRAEESDDETVEASEDTTTWRVLRFYSGADDQLPDPTYEAAVGAGNAPAYIGRGTLMLEGVSLGSSGQLPNLTFEIGQSANSEERERFFHAPFSDGTARDVEPEPLAAEIVNVDLLSFSNDAVVFRNEYLPNQAPRSAKINWSGSKIAPIVAGAVFELQARISIDGIRTEGFPRYPDQELIFGIYGFGVAAWWGVTISEGAPLIVATIQANATGQSAILGSPPGSDVPYRIVVNATASGSVQFFIGDDLVFSGTMYASALDKITVGVQGQPFADHSVLGLTCYDVQGLLGIDGGSRVKLLPVPLGDVVTELCERCGVSSSNIDVTELDGQLVHAMAVQPTSARAVLEQLAAAYYFECVESDKLYFRRRGGAAVATIPYQDVGAESSINLQDGSDLELPAQVNVTYLNLNNSYQQGNEVSDRITTDSTAISSLQLGIGLTPAAAKAIADTAVLDQTIATRTFTSSVDNRYSSLEPTDVVIVEDSKGFSYRARLVRVSDASGVRSVEMVADDARILKELGITSEDYEDDYVVMPLAETDLAILDIPLLRDQDDNPGLYAAGDGLRGAWPGYVLFRNGTEVGRSTTGAAMGLVTEALGDWSSLLMDEAHVITVTLNPGDQLASITHADMATSVANYAAIGAPGRWEIVQYQRAELVSTGVYRVSGIARGRLGTEHLRGTHVVGDRFVGLDGSGMLRDVGNLADLGVLRTYKAVTQGARIDSGPTATVTPVWQGLRPLAPVGARQIPTGSGDIVLQWGRRSRYANNVLLGILPLAEATESYEVDILGTGGVVVRTLTSSVPTVTYTATQQISDFGEEQEIVSARIYQISASVGRGQPASL